MYFASINEAFGVDSLEKPAKAVEAPKTKKKIERVKFPDELLDDGGDDDDMIPTMIPEERKLSDYEVKKYISNLYTKQGMTKVWNLLDKKIQRNIIKKCNDSIKNVRTWIDDIVSSPEKLLVILAILFVLILLLDSNSSKKAEAPMQYRQEYLYYTPGVQYTQPPVELRW